MHLLLAHRRERSMSRAKDRVIVEGEDLFAIVFQRVSVGNPAAAHRSSKHGISDDGNGPGQSVHDVSDAAARMAAGQAGFDLESADGEVVPGFEGLSFLDGFE